MPGPSVSEIRAKWKELGLWEAFQEMAIEFEREYGPARDDYIRRRIWYRRGLAILRWFCGVAVSWVLLHWQQVLSAIKKLSG